MVQIKQMNKKVVKMTTKRKITLAIIVALLLISPVFTLVLGNIIQGK